MGYRESMQCLLKSFMCELYGVIGRYISVGAVNYSQGHNLFKGFLDLLTSVYPKPRSVSFYAETLNVTSKYLSSVCKATCGETASMLIHKAVTKDIADLLSYSNKSIKEIMVELDFPSSLIRSPVQSLPFLRWNVFLEKPPESTPLRPHKS